MPTCFTYLPSPLGRLLLTSDGAALTGIYFDGHKGLPAPGADWRQDEAPFAEARAQLGAYFAGRLTAFDLPVRATGTPFQERVWRALQEIPYGTTISYGALAERLGDVKAVRAVGVANGRNPVSIVVPCHRVIGADGALTGYGGGIERKQALLRLEAANVGLFAGLG